MSAILLTILLRGTVGAVCLLAGLAKFSRFAVARQQLTAVLRLPPVLAGITAAFFAGTEIVLGAMILFGMSLSGAFATAAGMFGVFAIGVLVLVAMGHTGRPCGCFARSGKISKLLAVQNLGLTLLSVSGYLLELGHQTIFLLWAGSLCLIVPWAIVVVQRRPKRIVFDVPQSTSHV